MSIIKRIGQVADELDLNPKTIRYYEEIGLIPKAQRNEVGYRVYDESQIDRLAFILRARALDFSLDEIREILALRERGEAPCLYVSERIQQRVEEISNHITASSVCATNCKRSRR